MRNTFIRELVKQARKNDNIALIVGDLGFSVVEPFSDEFPDRFINAGVAEQNMTGIAAGMASEGYHVFTYSIANFPTFRCAEQIRNDIDYHNLPVTIVSVGGGLVYGNLGYSHHAVQDYALLRSLPNMLIVAPGDSLEVKACLRFLIANPQPSYLRLGKTVESSFHTDVPEVKPGHWVEVSTQGKQEQVILSTGGTLAQAMVWRQNTRRFKLYSVCSLPLWGMSYKADQILQVKEVQKLVILEDHLNDGGFASWMLEAVVGKPELLGRITSRALSENIIGMVGTQKMLEKEGGIR